MEEWNERCPECDEEIEDIPFDEESVTNTENRYHYECSKCGFKFWIKQILVVEE